MVVPAFLTSSAQTTRTSNSTPLFRSHGDDHCDNPHAVSGSGADVSVNSASGVIARKLSNELKDLASVAKTEQDVLHMFDWSDDERLGVQIGWYCCVIDIHRCEDNRHAESKM